MKGRSVFLTTAWFSGKPHKAVLIVIFIGLFLRLPGLFLPSLTGDEMSTVDQASVPLMTMLQRLASIDIPGADIAPPFYYIILNLFLKLFPFSVGLTRSLSLLFDVLTIVCVFRLGRHVFDASTALTASLFVAVSPFHIWYASEIRMYALVALLATLSSLSLLRYGTSSNSKYLYLYWLFSTLGLYTQYYFSFILVGHMVAVFISFRRHLWPKVIMALTGVGLAFVPWLPALLNDLKVLSSNVIPEEGHPLFIPVYVLLKLVFFGNRFFILAHKGLYIAGASLIAVLFLLYFRHRTRSPQSIRFIFVCVVSFLLLIFMSSFFSDQAFRPHAALVLLPLVLIMLAHWLEVLPSSGLRLVFRSAFLVIWGLILILYNQDPLYGKARVKEALFFVKTINLNHTPVFNLPLKIPCSGTIMPGSFLVIDYYADKRFPVHFLTGEDVRGLYGSFQAMVGRQRDFYLIFYENNLPAAVTGEWDRLLEQDFRCIFRTRFESRVDTFPVVVSYYRLP